MPASAATIAVVARQGDTLDALCWRHLGKTAGAVEASLAHPANARLADAGAHIQMGRTVTLVNPPQPLKRLVQLWD